MGGAGGALQGPAWASSVLSTLPLHELLVEQLGVSGLVEAVVLEDVVEVVANGGVPLGLLLLEGVEKFLD